MHRQGASTIRSVRRDGADTVIVSSIFGGCTSGINARNSMASMSDPSSQ